jgi:hypothetical protein
MNFGVTINYRPAAEMFVSFGIFWNLSENQHLKLPPERRAKQHFFHTLLPQQKWKQQPPLLILLQLNDRISPQQQHHSAELTPA